MSQSEQKKPAVSSRYGDYKGREHYYTNDVKEGYCGGGCYSSPKVYGSCYGPSCPPPPEMYTHPSGQECPGCYSNPMNYGRKFGADYEKSWRCKTPTGCVKNRTDAMMGVI